MTNIFLNHDGCFAKVLEKNARHTRGAKGSYFVARDHINIKQYFGNIFHLLSYYFISKSVINNNNLSQLVINSKKDIPSHSSS